MKYIAKLLGYSFCVLSMQTSYAAVDAQTQEFLNKLNSSGSKPMEQLTPQQARGVLINAQKSVSVDVSGIDVTNKTITVDNKPLDLTIVRPAGNKAQLPVFMFFHGGGWVLGDYKTHERLIRDLVVNSGAAAVYVNYTPSPEAKYPTAINQAYAATKWVADHGEEINVDGSRLAVVGNSVGGNMAAVVALMAKEKGTPKISYQVLLWPVTNANFEDKSYNQFAKGYFLTKNMMKWFWDNYLPDKAKRKEIYASPLMASKEQLVGLPPALVFTAENDVLRDEGEAYAANMNAAGVPVASLQYKGLIHDFGLLNPIATVPGNQAAMLQAATELKRHLQ